MQIAVPLTQPRANSPASVLIALTPRQGRPRSITWWCAHQPRARGGMTQSDARRELKATLGIHLPGFCAVLRLEHRDHQSQPRRQRDLLGGENKASCFAVLFPSSPREEPGNPKPLGAFSVLGSWPARAEPLLDRIHLSLTRAVGCWEPGPILKTDHRLAVWHTLRRLRNTSVANARFSSGSIDHQSPCERDVTRTPTRAIIGFR